MIKQMRTREDYQTKVEQAIQREISLAQEGQIAAVSSKAAAFYLGKHKDTLADWRQPPPKGPPFDKGADGIGVRNEHVSYPWPELVAWKKGRAGKTARERKLQGEIEKTLQQAREADLQVQLQEARDQLARLSKKLGRKLGFATVADCASQEDWVSDGQRLIGHVLTVDDATLDAALDADQVISASLAEALTHPWEQGALAPFLSAWEAVMSVQIKAMAEADAQSNVLRTDADAVDLGAKTRVVDRKSERRTV